VAIMNCASPRVVNCRSRCNSSSCIFGDRAFSGSSSRYSPFLLKRSQKNSCGTGHGILPREYRHRNTAGYPGRPCPTGQGSRRNDGKFPKQRTIRGPSRQSIRSGGLVQEVFIAVVWVFFPFMLFPDMDRTAAGDSRRSVDFPVPFSPMKKVTGRANAICRSF